MVAAVRCAACHVRHAYSGLHDADAWPVAPVGSYTHTAPRDARWWKVWSSRSVFTEVASTGPVHSSNAGMANPAVFPQPVGPITARLASGSPATRRRPRRPRVIRPAV